MDPFTRENLDGFTKKARETMLVAFKGPITKIQRQSTMDRGVRGPLWVSRTTFPSPAEDDLRSLMADAIQELGDGSERYEMPPLAPVPAQWVGVRSGVAKDTPEPSDMTEKAKFDALAAETSSDMTIMYMYGGGHYMNGPATRRATARSLCRLTGARCVIVQHSLAPQSPFPAQLLDVLHAYFSLLYPPPGSFHAPIDSNKIVLAADSTGSSLALGIIQIILAVRKNNIDRTFRFHDRSVPAVLPAGVALQSPSVGGFLPSWEKNGPTDILPIIVPYHQPGFPADAAWPTNPPREDLYITHLRFSLHPLVDPMMASRWAGAPPMYIAIGGGEMQLDPAKVVAQTAARQGVAVIWDEYELMPHNWPMLLPGWPQSDQCMERWADTCAKFASSENHRARTSGSVLSFEVDRQNGTRCSSTADVLDLTGLTARDVRRAMERGIEDIRKGTQEFMERVRSRL